jgi:hypothetical protein
MRNGVPQNEWTNCCEESGKFVNIFGRMKRDGWKGVCPIPCWLKDGRYASCRYISMAFYESSPGISLRIDESIILTIHK